MPTAIRMDSQLGLCKVCPEASPILGKVAACSLTEVPVSTKDGCHQPPSVTAAEAVSEQMMTFFILLSFSPNLSVPIPHGNSFTLPRDF